MFEFIRTHQRLMQFFLLLLIIPSFIAVGIGGSNSFRDADNSVAKVGKQSITQQEWDNALREQLNRYRQAAGAQFDPKFLDTPEEKQKVLDGLITERVMAATVESNRLTVSDQTIRQQVAGIAGLSGADGKFDNERYRTLLAAQGMTPAGYEARLRKDMAMQQLNAAIQTSAFSPKSVAMRVSDIGEQEREVQELVLKSADYTAQAQAKVSDDMVKTYYTQNSKKFEVPDQLKAEYLVLSNATVAERVSVPDADVKAFYETNKAARYTVAEQRRASHILLNVKKDASAAEKASVKAKAEALLAEVRKTPADFAKIAKANSQDTGSGERGGDLDFFGPGMMVKPFEETAYKLKNGEISDLVQSEFGYHIIMLTDVKPATVKSLDEVKGEIIAELKKQPTAKKYAEMAEVFTNMVDDQSDSLKPAATKLELKIETASNLTRQPSAALASDAPYNNPKFLKAMFTDDVLKNKRNTPAVEIAPGLLVAGRVLEYKPVTVRPLDEVKGAIHDLLVQIESGKMTKAAGEAKLAALKAGGDATGFAEPKVVSRAKAEGLSNAALPLVMKADTTKLPAYVGIETPGRGYSVYRINKVAQAAKPDVARRASEQAQIGNVLAQQEMYAYLEVLKQRAKVKILKAATASPVMADAKGDAGSEAK
jgi:peptidyl-prolyl cis-trans isomerase D